MLVVAPPKPSTTIVLYGVEPQSPRPAVPRNIWSSCAGAEPVTAFTTSLVYVTEWRPSTMFHPGKSVFWRSSFAQFLTFCRELTWGSDAFSKESTVLPPLGKVPTLAWTVCENSGSAKTPGQLAERTP